MSDHYPRICEHRKNGNVQFRVGLSFAFYMFRPHTEVVRGVMRALETYLDAVGPHALTYYADDEGDAQTLDAAGWSLDAERYARHPGAAAVLFGAGQCYRFTYSGRSLGQSPTTQRKGEVCEASFWLPTEFLEAQGPARVRELALAMAAPLPFSSGHAGLSFNGGPVSGTKDAVRAVCFRFPGIDISGELVGRHQLGTLALRRPLDHLSGPARTGRLGGRGRAARPAPFPGHHRARAGRRSRGHHPGRMARGRRHRAGRPLPAYRELARVLEPWLYFEEHYGDHAFPDKHQWERRFLD